MKNFKLKQNANALALGFFILLLVLWFFWDFQYKGIPIHQVENQFKIDWGITDDWNQTLFVFDSNVCAVACYREDKFEGVVGIYTTKPFPYTGYFRQTSELIDSDVVKAFDVEGRDAVAVVSLNGRQVAQVGNGTESKEVDPAAPFAVIIPKGDMKGNKLKVLTKDGEETAVGYYAIR